MAVEVVVLDHDEVATAADMEVMTEFVVAGLLEIGSTVLPLSSDLEFEIVLADIEPEIIVMKSVEASNMPLLVTYSAKALTAGEPQEAVGAQLAE